MSHHKVMCEICKHPAAQLSRNILPKKKHKIKDENGVWHYFDKCQVDGCKCITPEVPIHLNIRKVIKV